jgi:cell division protein FtsW
VILIYFVGGGNPKYILVSLAIAAIWAASVYGVWKMWDGKGGISYISSRIDTFLRSNEELFIKWNARDKDYQTRQGLITIWSGGFGGLGFGKSIQKFGYLPEVQGDFIFSVFVEELGFVGALVLISLYLYIVHRCYRIAFASTDPFARIVAFGVATLIFVQASINIWVNLNIVPLTGVTLPFMSYGGSSLLTLMIGVGIVVSISRTVDPDRLANTNAMSRRIVQG